MKDLRSMKKDENFDNELKKIETEAMLIKLVVSSTRSLDTLLQTISKQNFSRKKTMKAMVTILDSSYSANKDECIFVAFIGSKFVKDPPITTSRAHKVIEDYEDEQDPLDFFNELLSEHIKENKYKDKKKDLERLEEKDKKLSILKAKK